MLRMLSLCSGIGGADLAAEWTEAIEVIGQVEIDPFCQQVLAKHWPKVQRMKDIKDVTGDEFGEVDLIVAGFPCQGNSLAGKRQGSKDERNLWPEVRRIISATQPRWVVAENVCGLLTVESGRFFSGILSDLVSLGYRVGWGVYGACEVGAPHRRERIFIMAHSNSNRQWKRSNQPEPFSQCEGTANTGTDGKKRIVAHAGISRWQECNVSALAIKQGHIARCDVEDSTACRFQEQQGPSWAHDKLDASGERQSQSRLGGDADGLSARLDRPYRWPAGPEEPQHNWEPPRVVIGKQPDRAKRLKALGNAIVPQQIYPIFKQIVEWEGHEILQSHQ